jgi:ankyrin repeat protein
VTPSGISALLTLAGRHEPDCVKALLDAGADIHAVRPNGTNAVFASCYDPDTLRLVIAAGGDVNAKDRKGDTSLMVAAGMNAADCAKQLIAAGADVNAKNDKGNTALLSAKDKPAIAAMLKAAGATE